MVYKIVLIVKQNQVIKLVIKVFARAIAVILRKFILMAENIIWAHTKIRFMRFCSIVKLQKDCQGLIPA